MRCAALALLCAAAAAEPEGHPGHVTGYETLFSRRLQRWFFQHHATQKVSWEKPEEPEKTYWWDFHNMDCGYDDIEETCVGDSLAVCKSKCEKNLLCGGFNFPHGIMKKRNCLTNKSPSTVDLYIKEDHPQPPPPPPVSNFPPIWPHPKQFSAGKENISVAAGAAFSVTAATSSKDLVGAFRRFRENAFPHPTPNASLTSGAGAGLSGVKVNVVDTSGKLQLETDESYTLSVPASGEATISAKTVFGAMHALETLSQLIVFNFDTQSYGIAHAPWSIDDAPRFHHREVLVDTSRHFQPVETLKKLIQSFTYSKVNTVHWQCVTSLISVLLIQTEVNIFRPCSEVSPKPLPAALSTSSRSPSTRSAAPCSRRRAPTPRKSDTPRSTWPRSSSSAASVASA